MSDIFQINYLVVFFPLKLSDVFYLVHGWNGEPAMLPLSQVQDRDGGSLLVTLRVVCYYGFNSLLQKKQKTKKNS